MILSEMTLDCIIRIESERNISGIFAMAGTQAVFKSAIHLELLAYSYVGSLLGL